ncbi:MAG: molybdopterin cofactor-binding domain-containing protein, partial [Pseudomonadota bacterium]
MSRLSRRAFLARCGWAGGGITVLSGCGLVPPLPTFGTSDAADIYTWVQLRPDGSVLFYLPRAEMGQGICTGLTQVVAEELNVALKEVNCQQQDTSVMQPCQMTVGSQSIENYYELTALAAASLRQQLHQRAAAQAG